ncbi:MAG: tetratricopeptide repeat protein [Sulfurovum sp.]
MGLIIIGLIWCYFIYKEEQLIEKYKKAVEVYQKSIMVNYNYIGYSYFKLKDYNKSIEAYQKSLEINPKKDEAYVCLFEIKLIQNQLLDKMLEKKYIELFSNQTESFMVYEMLKTIEDVANNKETNIESWKSKYKNIGLYKWNWDYNKLDDWIKTIKDKQIKTKLLKAIEVFKSHNPANG